MTDPSRQRLYSLLERSNTFQAGQLCERDRLRLLIDVRIDQLRGIDGIRNREQMCAELLRLRQIIEP
jgi:hypothetical protein